MTETRFNHRWASLSLAKIALTIAFASLVGVAAAIASQTSRLSERDNGKTFTVSADGILVVSLKSNPSTGYRWRIAQDDREYLRPVGETYEPPTRAMPGAPGRQVFRFQARSPGTTTLELDYARPWEKNTPPAETFGVTVTIQ